nr:hypothetical protein [Actinokineospora sp. UTMC 2448]
MAVEFDADDGVAAGEGVAVAGPGVAAEVEVFEGAVVGVADGEAVDGGLVVAEAHVVAAAGGVEAFAVVAVEVEGVLAGLLRVGLVDAGEGLFVVGAVGGVAVGGSGVAGVGGEGFDVGVGVVAVVGVLGDLGPVPSVSFFSWVSLRPKASY